MSKPENRLNSLNMAQNDPKTMNLDTRLSRMLGENKNNEPRNPVFRDQKAKITYGTKKFYLTQTKFTYGNQENQ